MLHLLRVYGKSLESSQWPPVHRPLLAAEYSRRKKNVWYQGAALLIQRRGIKNSQAKIPGSLEYSGWRRIRTALAYDRKIPERICSGVVVDGEGFEPSKASPTLQYILLEFSCHSPLRCPHPGKIFHKL